VLKDWYGIRVKSPPTRSPEIATARASALLYPALAAPAVLLLCLTAVVRRQPQLLVAAPLLLGVSVIAGLLTRFGVDVLQPTRHNVVLGFLYWVTALVAAIAMALGVVIRLVPSWQRVMPANGVGYSFDAIVALLAPSCLVAALLLAGPISGNSATPVPLRPRQGPLNNGTILELMGLLLVLVIARAATREDARLGEDFSTLRARLPQLRQEAEEHPDHFRSQYRLGRALTALSSCVEALPPLRTAVDLDPSDGWAQNDLGITLGCLGRYGEAIEPFRASVRLMPKEPRPRFGLA
jgi:hypothetical protein